MYSSGLAAVSALAEAPPAEGVTQLPTPNEEFSNALIACVVTLPNAVNPVADPSSICLSLGSEITLTVTVSTCKTPALENTLVAPAADIKHLY